MKIENKQVSINRSCSRNRGSLPLVEDLSTTVRSLPSRSAHKK